jgi:MFS family permease
LTPAAAHLPPSLRLTAIVANIFLFTLSFNVAYDPYQALLADITPEAKRGRAMSFWYLLNAAGQVSILFIANIPLTYKFGILAGIMLLTTIIAVVMTPEQVTPGASAGTKASKNSTKDILSAFKGFKTLLQTRYYMWMFLCYGAGTEAVVPNITRFVKSITHCGNHQAEMAFMTLLLATAVCSMPCGWMADRIGCKRTLSISLAFICAAALLALAVKTLPEIWIVMTLAGIGAACQNASAYPLLTRLVPPKEIGFYTGIYTAALSVTTPIALYIAGMLTHLTGYRIVFIICASFSVIAWVFLIRIDVIKAVNEIAKRELEIG